MIPAASVCYTNWSGRTELVRNFNVKFRSVEPESGEELNEIFEETHSISIGR